MAKTLDLNAALVVLSGGQDSVTCLYWAIHHYARVAAVHYRYGSRHQPAEDAAVAKLAELAEVTVYSVDIPYSSFNETSSMLAGGPPITHEEGELPSTFLPGRNLIFLAYAGALAYELGASDVVIGVSQADYSGYPDCRDATLSAMQSALSLGLDAPLFQIVTPLIYYTKAEAVQLAKSLPGCMDALAWSHTCYEGQYPPCGKCPACILRAKGFAEAGVPDPLMERWYREQDNAVLTPRPLR